MRTNRLALTHPLALHRTQDDRVVEEEAGLGQRCIAVRGAQLVQGRIPFHRDAVEVQIRHRRVERDAALRVARLDLAVDGDLRIGAVVVHERTAADDLGGQLAAVQHAVLPGLLHLLHDVRGGDAGIDLVAPVGRGGRRDAADGVAVGRPIHRELLHDVQHARAGLGDRAGAVGVVGEVLLPRPLDCGVVGVQQVEELVLLVDGRRALAVIRDADAIHEQGVLVEPEALEGVRPLEVGPPRRVALVERHLVGAEVALEVGIVADVERLLEGAAGEQRFLLVGDQPVQQDVLDVDLVDRLFDFTRLERVVRAARQLIGGKAHVRSLEGREGLVSFHVRGARSLLRRYRARLRLTAGVVRCCHRTARLHDLWNRSTGQEPMPISSASAIDIERRSGTMPLVPRLPRTGPGGGLLASAGFGVGMRA